MSVWGDAVLASLERQDVFFAARPLWGVGECEE